MDELLIELLNMAEKHGILTGGTDDDGNAAYVVIDSGSNITVIVRPGGRAQVIVDGEESNFDITDEEADGIGDFIEALAQALVEDNLDHKTDKLTKLFEEFTQSLDDEEGDEDEESDEDEDEEDDEDVDLEDDDGEVIEDDVAEDEDEDEDDSDEEEKPKLKMKKKGKGKPFGKKKSMGDEDNNEDEGGDEEAAVEVAHSDIVINQTLLPLGFKVTYDAAVDETAVDRYVVIASDTREKTDFVIETPGEYFNVKRGNEELYSGTNARTAAVTIAMAIDPDYETPLTESEVAVAIDTADYIINNMVELAGEEPEAFDMERITAALEEVALGDGYSVVKEEGEEEVAKVTVGGKVYNVPAEFMVPTAAVFAKLASEATNQEVAHKMMRLALKLGFNGKAAREEAALDRQVEVAISQAALRAEIRKLKILTVKFDGSEVQLRFTKDAMPDAERREATETPTDMEDALGTAKHMVDWYKRSYEPTLKR